MKINEVTNINDEADALFEMSNLRKNTTGLPVNIYVSSGGSVNHKHGPRIKAMITGADKFDVNSTVSILLKKDITADDVVGYQSLPTNILNALRDYININYDALLAHWNDEIDAAELIQALRRLQ
jgi:hypothetical protein